MEMLPEQFTTSYAFVIMGLWVWHGIVDLDCQITL